MRLCTHKCILTFTQHCFTIIPANVALADVVMIFGAFKNSKTKNRSDETTCNPILHCSIPSDSELAVGAKTAEIVHLRQVSRGGHTRGELARYCQPSGLGPPTLLRVRTHP